MSSIFGIGRQAKKSISRDAGDTSTQDSSSISQHQMGRHSDSRAFDDSSDRDMVEQIYEALKRKEKTHERELADAHDKFKFQLQKFEREIGDYKSQLDESRQKLRTIQETHLRAAERSNSVDDSFIAREYTRLVNNVKNIIQELLRNVEIQDVKNLLFKQSEFLQALEELLGSEVSCEEMNQILEGSKNQLNLIKLLLRAVLFSKLRLTLFNSQMFFGTDPGLRNTYNSLLSDSMTPDPSHRREASIWRSQTLQVLDRNADRLGVTDRRKDLKEKVSDSIFRILEPLRSLNKSTQLSAGDIAMLVEEAANLSITLGQQRAMFDLQSVPQLGREPNRSIMSAFWCGGESIDEEEGALTSQEYFTFAAIFPALVKYGNADGESYDKVTIQVQADVLVVELTKWLEIKTKDLDHADLSRTEGRDREVSPLGTEFRRRSADEKMSLSTELDKPDSVRGAETFVSPTTEKHDLEPKNPEPKTDLTKMDIDIDTNEKSIKEIIPSDVKTTEKDSKRITGKRKSKRLSKS